MPLTSKLRMRYQRRIGFPGYSHLELEIEEEVIMEEGDEKEEVAALVLSQHGHLIKMAMQPVVNLYSSNKELPVPDTKSSPEGDLKAEAAASAKAHEKKEKARAAAGQPTLEGVLDEEPEDLPAEREPGRDLPTYSVEGKRVRGAGQKGFIMNEINVTWAALSEAGIVSTKPDMSKGANKERQDIRNWLKMSPLDPKFSHAEMVLVIESYGKWRGQGLTTAEAMMEVASDYNGIYGSDAGGSDGAGEGAESDQAEDEPVDQDAGSDDNDEDGAADVKGAHLVIDKDGEPEAEAED